MSLEQSKKIVEAAEDLDSYCGCNEAQCTEPIPDLSLPTNHHLLIGYVEKICDTDEKRATFGGELDDTTTGGARIHCVMKCLPNINGE